MLRLPQLRKQHDHRAPNLEKVKLVIPALTYRSEATRKKICTFCLLALGIADIKILALGSISPSAFRKIVFTWFIGIMAVQPLENEISKANKIYGMFLVSEVMLPLYSFRFENTSP